MRSIRARVALALLASVLLRSGVASGAEPATAISPAPAKRVVSLNPSLTSILVALGAADALVGVDDFSARQEPGVAGLPRVGGLYDPNLEAVVTLRPDLVVLVHSVQQRDFLEQLRGVGIPVLELDPTSFEDVLRSIETLGARVGRPETARTRVAEIREAKREVERVASDRKRPRTVLVLQRDPLYVVGRGSFIDEMLVAAGADNVAGGLAEPYPRAGLEWLVAAAPELILDAASDPEPAAAYWSRWSSMPAVKANRIVAVDAGLVTLPGPALDRALVALSRAIQGVEPPRADDSAAPREPAR
jgi:iron complex transport system substrate-binding protein